ncbi:protein NATD1 isoform X2 [Grus americana]|uniref:protein NATD1 isoform X2 n=1 Tax=Grus americana TaxID=9117 RepID=UPI0024081488|nr:protein NATD1 isoform X2 [Grus americana]
MAHSAPLGLLEQGCPIQVEHDRKRRQFTVRLNATNYKVQAGGSAVVEQGRRRACWVQRKQFRQLLISNRERSNEVPGDRSTLPSRDCSTASLSAKFICAQKRELRSNSY